MPCSHGTAGDDGGLEAKFLGCDWSPLWSEGGTHDKIKP